MWSKPDSRTGKPLILISVHFIQAVNHFKIRTPLFQGEGRLVRISEPNPHLLVLERSSVREPGKRAIIAVNIHSSNEQILSKDRLPGYSNNVKVVHLSWIDQRGTLENFYDTVTLKPSEVIAILDNDES